MNRIWLRKGLCFRLAGRDCVIEERLSNGDLRIKDSASGDCFVRSYEQLLEALADGQLDFSEKVSVPKGLKNEEKAMQILEADFSEMPRSWREESKRRLSYISEIVNRRVTSLTENTLRPLISNVAQAIGDAVKPSWRTVCRWSSRFKASGESIRSLVPLKGCKGPGDSTLDEDVKTIIGNAIDEEYLKPQRITVAAVYESVALRIENENRFRRAGNKLKKPNRSTIYRIVSKLDPYEKLKARYGKRIADLKYGTFKQGVRPTRPLERVEIDHTKTDLFVVDPDRGMPIGRAWLTTAIDVFSKCVLGYYLSFNPPSYLSVMQCLRHAVFPKPYVRKKYPNVVNAWNTHGLPETVVVDNGKEFLSTHFEDACLQLGILIQYAPIRLAWYKGSVERFFGTLNTRLLHQQPGTTFSDIFDRQDYDPAKSAVIDKRTLEELLHIWIIDDYHRREHRGIKNIPAVVWDEGIAAYPPALPPNRKEVDVLLGMIAERTVSSSGIELHGLFYNDKDLALIRRGLRKGEKIKVKFDPDNLSFIYAFDASKGTFIPVPAVDQAYTQNLSLWQHEVIKNVARKEVREKVNVADLAKARKTIEEVVRRGWATTKKNATRLKLARFLKHGEMDRGSAPMETQNHGLVAPVVQIDTKKRQPSKCRGNESARGISDPAATTVESQSKVDMTEQEDGSPSALVVEGKSPSEHKEQLLIPGISASKRKKAKLKSAKPQPTLTVVNAPAKDSEEGPEGEEDLDTTGWDADQKMPAREV